MPNISLTAAERPRWRGVLVIIGGILIHLSLGTVYTFGNLSPYLTSYMRWYGSAPDLRYTDSVWIQSVSTMGLGFAMFLGGVLQACLGPKLACLLGSWLMSLGVFLTYFTVKHSFILTNITYGLVLGMGAGIAYAIPMSCAVKWFPEKKGLVNGVVVAWFGGGAVIFDEIQTAFLNPDNMLPQNTVGDETYFDQPSVLERVPKVFLLLGGCYAAMQLVGCLLLCDPPDRKVKYEYYAKDQLVKAAKEYETKGPSDPLLPRTDSESSSVHRDEDDTSFTPLEMLRSKHFYILWFIFLFNGQGVIFTAALWKAYGQTFIEDDEFLALTGSVSAAFNAVGRILWGYLADKTDFKFAMVLVGATSSCLILIFIGTALQGRELFFLHTCLLMGTFSGSFPLILTALAKCFGPKHLATNIGLIFTSLIVTAPVVAFLTQTLKVAIGWAGLFFLIGGFSSASMVMTLLFTAKDKSGKQI